MATKNDSLPSRICNHPRLPSRRLLNQLLYYDAETGFLFWKPRPVSLFPDTGYGGAPCHQKKWNTRRAGTRALTAINKGYCIGSLLGLNVSAHRVIWKMHTGKEPTEIDHINGDRTDNRMENLRAASRVANSRNLGLARNNRSGATGVHWGAREEKWIVRIKVAGHYWHIGSFTELAAAIKARKSAQERFGFSKNHGGRSAHG
jgi:hypothetical protein